MEASLEELAKRLDRYPNFAVDTSARLGDLAMKEREVLVAFFRRYIDRRIFGTDGGLWGADPLNYFRSNLATERAFFEGDGPVEIQRRQVRGLALEPALLERLYRGNAQRWYPGL